MTIRSNLKRLAAVSTEIPRIHYREGLESGFMDDYESAIESFDRVNYITVGSSYWTRQSQYYKANAYSQLEQYEKAIEEYKKLLATDKKNSACWVNLGASYVDLEKFDEEALSCFDKSLLGASEDEDLAIRILNGRGHSFYYMEQYPEAIKAYFEAMRINKDKVTGATLYNMGTAYAFVELYDDAIKCFKQAMPRGLEDDQKKMCKEQIKRCNELQKIQKRKLSR